MYQRFYSILLLAIALFLSGCCNMTFKANERLQGCLLISHPVQTFNHVEKIVPNQKFLTSSVVTYTVSDRISRYLIPVGVSYNSEPETVIEILLKVAKEKARRIINLSSLVYLFDLDLGKWLLL